ncbi:hypothetical protein HYH03_012649 [Edaphochlamys debaryana]|uniref:Glutathione S-transferase n=1 Tax=Edaphochlamys debaryana TaxID=47281 RepID=A0A835XRE6_9CHLO|nr:hypothetical protein HYH03_012649 [Edaphochlamys debaryana]|eukprot:KAG2488853.1 hypothetical protein HYH03_012649 [Edaphochlamys debaryana]
MVLKLHYFALPGRAEVTRLCLTIGGIPFEDVHYTQETYPAFKAKTPFGQVPVLELEDGKMLAQSGAIDRYVAKLAGLYPEDPLDAAHADQAVFLLTDLMDLFGPTWSLPLEEKVKAREAIMAGKGKEKMGYLAKLVAGGSYVAGGKLSFADLGVYAVLSSLTSGQYDGVSKTCLDEFPDLKAFRNKIASEPAVKAYYDKHAEGIRAAFKPDA